MEGLIVDISCHKTLPVDVTNKLKQSTLLLAGVLKKHAHKHPERVAINYYGREITCAELDELTDRFAGALREIGVLKGDRIILYMENCPQFIIATIGGWKAGAILVPFNPMLLGDELIYQLTDSGGETIILQDDLYPVFDAIRKRTPIRNIILTMRNDFLPVKPALPLHHTLATPSLIKNIHAPGIISFKKMLSQGPVNIEQMEMDDLALLQYTAGTTGMPKGAMIIHRNIMFNTVGSGDWYKCDLDSVHLAVLPLFEVTGFIHSMCMPLYTGGTIILLARYDTETVLEALEKYRCTNWVSITTMIIALINYPSLSKWDLTSLRYCSSGGSPVSKKLIELFKEVTGATLNEGGYGLSETISQVTLNPLDSPCPGSAGIPVQGTEIKIVDIDERDRELPPGEEGELLVKGPQVMKGYWNRPGETRQALHDGWLATGDVARVDKNGFVYIVGRKKELIKASGFIVFPQEVENFLYEHPAVAETVVVGVPDPYRVETVKAYIVLRQEYVNKIKEQDIIAWSRKKMAAYKYPRVVEFVPELPHNGTGKVIRHFLAE